MRRLIPHRDAALRFHNLARGKIGVRPLRLDWKLERRAQALAEYLAQVDEGLRVPYWSGECGEGENAAVVRKNSNMRRAMEIASESWWVMTWRTSRIMKQMGNRFFLQWTPSPFRRLANASMNYARSAEERMWLADGVFEVKDMALYGRYTQMIWHSTTHIGIAAAKADLGRTYVVARCWLSGNVRGREPYPGSDKLRYVCDAANVTKARWRRMLEKMFGRNEGECRCKSNIRHCGSHFHVSSGKLIDV
ncbi:hypothetical protein M433DRAFT_448017 [Acidomyces richmondensis BFW]|nr:hypothetical protein M433DRAFT_448017 [Acidomyces richmondensis BFW]